MILCPVCQAESVFRQNLCNFGGGFDTQIPHGGDLVFGETADISQALATGTEETVLCPW